MTNGITNKRWEEAQEAERACHDRLIEKIGEQAAHKQYEKTYQYYFNYLGIDKDQQGKTIVEIGCADYPALEWCHNVKGILIEPLPSHRLNEYVKANGYELIKDKVENIEIPDCDEIWLLNVLQHVQDPDVFIEKCKKHTIRFFEPIDCGIHVHHPHDFTEGWYRERLGDCVQNYFPRMGTDFHGARCVYGVWNVDL